VKLREQQEFSNDQALGPLHGLERHGFDEAQKSPIDRYCDGLNRNQEQS
jgi:hypothetical protein